MDNLVGQSVSLRDRGIGDPHVESFGNAEIERPTIDSLFHENTKLNGTTAPDFSESIERFLEENGDLASAVFVPEYHFHEPIDLPSSGEAADGDLSDVLGRRRSDLRQASKPVTIETLGQLLGTAIGVVEEATFPATEHGCVEDKPLFRRPYPSAGKLYPIEFYVAVRSVRGLEPGIYYYVPEQHRLRTVDRFDVGTDAYADLFVDSEPVARSDAAVLMSNVAARTRAKYGPRGYRFALVEAGHAGQNLQLVATSVGIGAKPYGGYLDDAVDQALGIDGFNAGVVNALLLAGGTGGREADSEVTDE